VNFNTLPSAYSLVKTQQEHDKWEGDFLHNLEFDVITATDDIYLWP